MQIKCCSFFNFMLFIVYFGKKKAHASSICKLFLFPKSNNPLKVATPKGSNPQRLPIPKVMKVTTIRTLRYQLS